MRIRTERSGSRKPFRIALTICLFGVFGGTIDLDDAAVIAPPDSRAQPVEREIILSMARDYRRTESIWLESVADAIYEESIRANVDPLLVASIIATESAFHDRAVSPAGAVGLMQLRPFVAEDVADRLDFEWEAPQSLSSPTVNVRLGIQYYKELVERFGGDANKALTAYNFGPTLVIRQIKEGTYAGSAYALSVLSLYARLGVVRTGDAA